MNAISTASALCALFVFPLAAYLGVLAALARRTWIPSPRSQSTRFAVVVPAHDEAASIEHTIKSLVSLDWPRELYEVIVVADNCTDDTAARAQKAGARVIVRDDPDKRGKGYALHHAFTRILRDGDKDAVVVVDADTIASANLLRAFAARLQSGAQAVQAEYGVRNVDASWRTRMMAIALAMFHRLRSLARERLAVSAGLRGNGMCFATSLLKKQPHTPHGLVEDVEYGIQLGFAGVRVHYAQEAFVLGEMTTTARAAASQRRRWEDGRRLLVARVFPKLLKEAVAKNDGMLLDLAFDLAVPPLSRLVAVVLLGLIVEAGLYRSTGAVGAGLPLWTFSLACIAAYVVRGVFLSGLGARGFTTLLWAPLYVAWKLCLLLPLWRRGAKGAWVRTTREVEHVARTDRARPDIKAS